MKILLIDDEPQYLDGVVMTLEDEGHFVKIECNPVQGVKLAQSENFDLVISDWKMPELKGHEVRDLLNEQMPKLKVFVWSNNPMECPKGTCLNKSRDSLLKILEEVSTKKL